MKIAFCGLGKLGFPVAMAYAVDHDVVGYDVSPIPKQVLASRKYPHREDRAQELIEQTTLRIVDTVDDAVAHADIVFVAVETPHRPEYEGVSRMPEPRADFGYKSLKQSVAQIADAAQDLEKYVVIVVVSTVLPGTSARELYPLIRGNSFVSFIYSPMFIAQTTVIQDALNPEFVLVGLDDSSCDARGILLVGKFFSSLYPVRKLHFMSVVSAELTKVAYNVFLGLKIVAANAFMELAHKTGANVDDVTDALAQATDRIISSKYMRGGMGDGGPCHPRDQIALSWLAQEVDLSFDIFGAMVRAREAQTEWLAYLCFEAAALTRLPIVVLGKAYKRGTNLVVGSPALLLKSMIDEQSVQVACEQWDPHVDGSRVFADPAVFIIATDHDELFAMSLPLGSVVIDPWGKFRDVSGIRVVRVGRHGVLEF